LERSTTAWLLIGCEIQGSVYHYNQKTMNATALFLVTHGSSDRRSWSALQDLVTVARSQSNLYISGGCLEGQTLTLAQQLEKFANEIVEYGVSTIVILPLLLLEGIHVSEDIPNEVAIAQSNLQNCITLRILPHLGTHSQIPDLLAQQFEKYSDQHSPEKQARILVSHGSRRADANQVVENLAKSSQSIAAYWGIEPKIETQIEHLITQGIDRINVLPYFLTEGGITEAIAHKLQHYRDRVQIRQLPVALSNEQLVNLALSMI
jgi:sirohydrochlorin cobaltochelatase